MQFWLLVAAGALSIINHCELCLFLISQTGIYILHDELHDQLKQVNGVKKICDYQMDNAHS